MGSTPTFVLMDDVAQLVERPPKKMILLVRPLGSFQQNKIIFVEKEGPGSNPGFGLVSDVV